jgi:hypothetical protein
MKQAEKLTEQEHNNICVYAGMIICKYREIGRDDLADCAQKTFLKVFDIIDEWHEKR